jgi:hypothetical protein
MHGAGDPCLFEEVHQERRQLGLSRIACSHFIEVMVANGLKAAGIHRVMTQDKRHVSLAVLDEGCQEVLHGDLILSPLEAKSRGRIQVPDQVVVQFEQKIPQVLAFHEAPFKS